jgi:glycosyltransferase involved in cell wall biosynthesis
MATFNGGDFIREQLLSILAQSVAPREIVVADDGSSDETLSILHEISATSPVPILILPPHERLGVVKNFERALSATSGELIALSDQDDRWHPTRLAVIARAFEADPRLDLVHTDARLVDGTGVSLNRTLLDSLRVSRRERRLIHRGRALEVLIRRNVVTGATAVLRRRLLDDALPVPEGWIHDEWLAIVCAATSRLQLIDDPLVDYRQHAHNTIGVADSSVSGRLTRALEPRLEQLHRLARRAEQLSDLLAPRPQVSASSRGLLDRKLVFERARSRYPASRLRRVLPVLANARGYSSLSSQGVADVGRDLLAPP